MDTSAAKKRILILGGGFGGVATARYLFALLFRPDAVKVGLDSETAARLCEGARGADVPGPRRDVRLSLSGK